MGTTTFFKINDLMILMGVQCIEHVRVRIVDLFVFDIQLITMIGIDRVAHQALFYNFMNVSRMDLLSVVCSSRI